mmetsp:Transcript_102674/g.306650  ORF Transcript_102674/g.306650 Transcript_102674/m.306650 type:complete len:977 (-) Transcript_102674:413-3343(-)
MPRLKFVERTLVQPAGLPEAAGLRSPGDGVYSLPRHLWCWVAQFVDAVDVATMIQCGMWLLGAFDVEALWLHLCLANDFARSVAGPEASWIYPFPPKLHLSHCVDWQQLLQVNMRLRSKPSVWIRVQDVDLRLPVPPETQSSKALTAQLCQVVSFEADSAAPAPTHPSRPRWSMRLRRMQWGGRPGTLLQDGASLLGGHFLLELSLPAWRGWPLPPTCLSSSASPGCMRSQPTKFRYQGVPVLTWLHGGSSAAHGATPSSPSRRESQALMIRLLSLLVPRELWLCVPLDATWGTLSEEIAKVLRRESPLLADLCRPVRYHLMDTQRTRRRVVVHASKPLRELFWAQSETLRVELETSSRRQHAPGAGAGETSGDTLAGSCMAVLIWREQAFREAPALPQDCPGVKAGCGLTSPWSRQMSEPATVYARGWSRQMSEPPLATASKLARQVSEPLEMPDEMTRELSEPPPLPGMGSSHLSPSPQERCWTLPEVPGNVDFDGEGPAPLPPVLRAATALGESPRAAAPECPQGDAVLRRRGPGHTGAATADAAWEHIVPHYAPQLLPRTLLTRQFEFHPTLPEVMLTGDKKGSVNILNLDTSEVHPPLVVGMCPLLGLVWMRHHPQRAICGASHSGKIMFLQYDPHARPSEPALQRLQTVEEFPKLSSLSSNCTDDFLLASGISPNIAVYDVQTGKVLHRAHGVHEHFINISRFCHTSPHIFATASFDHTCKVWDLRQPLSHDRPVKTLNTGSHNVMCVFSPDDKFVLCSGVDTRIMQFEVPSWRQTPAHFPLREPVHRERYRRSTYLATGRHFVTAATEESHMHLMTVDGRKLGVVDFRGVVRQWAERAAHREASRGAVAEQCCLQVPRLAMQLESRVFPSRAASHVAAQHRMSLASAQDGMAESVLCAVGHPQRNLVQGAVQLDDADPNGGSSRNNHEFIQSIRTHPLVKNRVGVLLSLTQAEQSYVALVDMSPRVLER